MIKALMVSLLVVGSVQAQKPNFAGTWIPVANAKPGNELVITQNDKQLALDYFSGGKSVRKEEFILDGAAHERTVSMRGTNLVINYKAAWQNNRLMITSDTAYPNGMKENRMETWSIDAKGQLVIDSTEKGPGGAGTPQQMVLARKK